MIWINFERSLELRLGLSEVAQLPKCASQIRVRVGVVRSEPNGLGKLFCGSAEVSLRRQSIPQVVVRVEIAQRTLGRSPQIGDRVIWFSCGQQSSTKCIVYGRILRTDLQRRLILCNPFSCVSTRHEHRSEIVVSLEIPL